MIYKILYIALLGSMSMAAQAQGPYERIDSVREIMVMQQNSAGTFDVICSNGNREKVTSLDLELNNVCPNRTSSVPSEILSVQKRSDGKYDVVCRNFTRLVADETQLISGEVCRHASPTQIKDGRYADQKTGNYCDQQVKSNLKEGKLYSLSITYLSPCGGTTHEYVCENLECKTSSRSYSLKITSSESYEYKGSSGTDTFKLKP